MCGISGYINAARNQAERELTRTVLRMASTLHHRGPDDVGTWVDPVAGVAFGHRRLSILDLSSLGHQPMESACGRYVTAFNGEIYNFRALRQELEGWGHRFRGHSDTEVMLAAFSQWGVESAVRRLNGMFAIALWDRETSLLHLVRDRMGEKPLYYGWMGRHFVFASELKAIRAHPQFDRAIDRGAVALFLRHNYIPAPYSIYSGIAKLPPGVIATIAPDPTVAPRVRPYWTVRGAIAQGQSHPFQGTEAEAIATLDDLLCDAVKIRMESDVPLGAFLSGGIDSSTVVAVMQAQSSRPVQTFSIGFHETEYNEAHHAKAVAEHLQTAHTELYVSPTEAMNVITKLPALYDEPFADASQIPTYLVCELTKRHVAVALSGDAGDELFAGYNQYRWALRFWNHASSLPLVLRTLLANAVTGFDPESWERGLRLIGPLLPVRFRRRGSGHTLHTLSEMARADAPEVMYRTIVSHWQDPASLVIGAAEPPTALTDRDGWGDLPDVIQKLMYIDMMMYLPDDILVKVDRASMAVSLEARVPFLDHRLVEFAWRLPMQMKLRQEQGKWILRRVLDRYVPAALLDRPKMGFGVPVDRWLRGPMKEWAETLLDEKRLRDQGFFEPGPIRKKWEEHRSGACNYKGQLWVVLMFQAWLDHVHKDTPVLGY